MSTEMSGLGFSVEELLPRARMGGTLKMGLIALSEDEWLQPKPDFAQRRSAFAADPGAIRLTPEADAPGRELAAMLGVAGGLAEAACSAWEDMCLLTPCQTEGAYRLVGAAVAFPTDWRPADKIGLPLTALHAPIANYREQLAGGVDHFMARLKPGAIFGRANWFVSPTCALAWHAVEPPEQAFAHVRSDNAGDTLFVRCERQTLRRLPQTGAIVFTIGVYVAPLGTLSAPNLARIAEAVATIPPEEAHRRGASCYAAQLQAFADARSQAIAPA